MRQNLLLLVAIFSASIVFGQTTPEEKLMAAGHMLPEATKPVANYVKWVRSGNLVFTAGHGSPPGKLGESFTIEQGYNAAQFTGLQLLATLKDAVGDLSKVKRIVKVLGFVHCVDGFKDHSKVMDGFSDLIVLAFGEKGKHARSSIGASSLPNGIALEIEIVVEVED